MNTGKEFEFAVLRLLQQIGFEAEVTGYSQDGGVDLVATNPAPVTGGRCVVQLQAQVFTAGVLTVSQGIEFWSPSADAPQRTGFSFSHVYFREVGHEMSMTGRLDLSFRTHPTDPPLYSMSFEGALPVT